MMLLAGACSNAMAEWVKTGSFENDTMYADPSTILREGNMVEMWALFDSKKAEVISGQLYMSMKRQSQYNCKDRQWRMLYLSFHSGSMGRGKFVDGATLLDSLSTWSPVPPRSGDELLFKIACGILRFK